MAEKSATLGYLHMQVNRGELQKVRVKLSRDALTIQKEGGPPYASPNAQQAIASGNNRREVRIMRRKVGGLGMSIRGGKESNLPIAISKIYKSQAAAASGQLYEGDIILEVNHQDMTDATHDEAVVALKESGPEVLLVVEHLGTGSLGRQEKQGAEPSIFKWSTPTQPKEKRRRILKRIFESNENVPPMPQEVIDIDTVETKDTEESTSTPTDTETDNISLQPQVEEKSTQTDWSFGVSASVCNDHNYAFCFMATPECPSEYQQSMQERLEVKTEILNNLRVKLGNLQMELDSYREKEFRLEKFRDDNSAIQFYTGFPNYDTFLHFFEYIEPKLEKLHYWGSGDVRDSQSYQEEGKSKPGPKRHLSAINEFFMVLVRLKVGLFVRDLADRFSISMGHFSKIFCTWINFLFFELTELFPFPSQSSVRQNMPAQFALYPTTRVIIDCTEIFVQVPSSMTAQSQTWSNYKHHNTFKVLVGISPNGQVTFVSKLWGGRVSDKCITQASGLIKLLDAGDNVMADRGFDISDILPCGVHLNIPPFKGSRDQLTAEEVQETVHIASVRIHVERAIGRIKGYHILDGTLPLSLAHVADQIFTVCSYLTNFLPPLLPPKSN